MAKLFTSDWHFGFVNKHQPDIKDMSNKQYEDLILNNLAAKTKPGDILYHLGDVGKLNKEKIDNINDFMRMIGITWQIIEGNHDKFKYQPNRILTYYGGPKTVKVQGYKLYLAHYPHITWESSHYGSYHLHGHIHKGDHTYDTIHKNYVLYSTLMLNGGKRLNVNVDQHHWFPWTEEEILEHMKEASDNFDLIKEQ